MELQVVVVVVVMVVVVRSFVGYDDQTIANQTSRLSLVNRLKRRRTDEHKESSRHRRRLRGADPIISS